MKKNDHIIEYGDFQTPLDLASSVVSCVNQLFPDCKTVLEPTCGVGTFLRAYQKMPAFRNVDALIGWEINPQYVDQAKKAVATDNHTKIQIEQKDFFQIDWNSLHTCLKFPVLFLGNPPWVTNSELGKLVGQNLPEKNNFKKHSGLDAMTGKSNFDISEWMMIRIAHFVSETESAMAFLIKTSVARKIFSYIFSNHLKINEISIKKIDAKKHFDVNVDACLFYARGGELKKKEYHCPVFQTLEDQSPQNVMGNIHRKIIADIDHYQQLKDIDTGSPLMWRSGVKHDCAKVMELKRSGNRYVNGFQETVSGIDDYLYPMYKSSDIAKERLKPCDRFMVVTQKHIGEETDSIEAGSKQTWNYLLKHASYLDARKSSIYKNSPRFAIFGVGDYTFKPWKVAISGLYKNCLFTLLGPCEEKPVVLDDTCYFLAFDEKKEAEFVCQLLTSAIAQSFIKSISFSDDKRPITATLLNRINLKTLAEKLGRGDEYQELFLADENHQRQFCFSS